jgi:hypothetical protein
LRGVHRGETVVARRHSWSVRVVARGLEQLSVGASYADVSRWALRTAGDGVRTRRRPDPALAIGPVGEGPDRGSRPADAEPADAEPAGDPAVPADPADDLADGGERRDAAPKRKRRKVSRRSAESHNVWHIAADWTEAFAPVVYADVEQRLRAAALAERARLDALLAAGQPVDTPQVLLLDDVPAYGRDADGSGKARRDAGFYVLVAAEVRWEPADAFDTWAWPVPRVQLRLVRAMAKSNAHAWRLCFDELGYHPDYVVADAATGILAAVDAHFDPARTRFVPSLWHLGNAVTKALAKTTGAFVAGPDGRQLLPDLAEHLRALSRGSEVFTTTDAWSGWWDELERLLVAHRLPLDKMRSRRRNYEPGLAAVLPALTAHPFVPLSTGGLETLIAKTSSRCCRCDTPGSATSSGRTRCSTWSSPANTARSTTWPPW